MEEKFGTGLIPSPYDVRDYTLAAGAVSTAELPEEFDLGIVKVKNQGTLPLRPKAFSPLRARWRR